MVERTGRSRSDPYLRMARRVRLVLLGATASALAACGADTTDNAGENTAQTCMDLEAYTDALGQLAQTLRPDASPHEIQAAHQQAAEAQQELDASISEVAKHEAYEVDRSWDSLMTSFTAAGGPVTPADAVEDLRTEVEEVVDATTRVGEDVECP